MAESKAALDIINNTENNEEEEDVVLLTDEEHDNVMLLTDEEQDNVVVLMTDDEQDSASLLLDTSLKSSQSQTSQDEEEEEDSQDASMHDNNNKVYDGECSSSPNRESKLDYENVDHYLKDHSLDQPSTSGFSRVLIEQIDKELSSNQVGAESKLEEFLNKPGTSGLISDEDSFTKPSLSSSSKHDDKFDEDTGLYKREVENTDLAPVINKEIGEKASSLLTYPCKPVTLSGAFYESEQKDNNSKNLYEIHNRNEDHISTHETSGLFDPDPEDKLDDEENHCQCIGDESVHQNDDMTVVAKDSLQSLVLQSKLSEKNDEKSTETFKGPQKLLKVVKPKKYLEKNDEYDSTEEHPEEDEKANEGSQSDDYTSTPRKRKNESPSSTVAKRPYRPSTTSNDVPIVEPEMECPTGVNTWLNIFTSWNGSDRLKAIEQLIKKCSADQVRHMMVTIEPLFQRDFISHLPEEVALQILRYLSPEDLLKAAQTSKLWKDLIDDNLLWKEQCQRVGITAVSRKTKLMPVAFASSWKAEYMRNKYIEHKWLTKPMKSAKILKAHDDHVITCLQFYGNIILSGSDDTTLKLWSAVTGKCLRTLNGHTGGVWSSQMYKKTVISGSTDRTLRVWDAETGVCLKILTGHTSTVRCMHLHEDRVVSGSRDATLRVWSVSEGQCLKVLVGHLAAVRCVQYDGKLVVSGAYDYYVKVWNPETGECLHTLEGHTNRVYSLQFDGHHIVSGSLDTSIIVWDVATGAIKHSLTGHQSLTSGMELKDNILVSGNADSTVKVWDIITGQCLHTLAGPNKHQSAVTCLQLNNRFVITSSDDGTVKLWDVKTGEFIRNLLKLDSGGSGGVVWRIRASETKLVCAVGSRNGTEETKLMVTNFDVPSTCLTCRTNAFL